MKKIKLLAIVLFSASMVSAQEYKFAADEKKGGITLKDGTTRVGYIDMKGGELTPWGNQSSVKFFSEDALADGKIKGKEREKFKPKDLAGYSVDGRYFESIKISHGKLTMGIGMMQTKFVERLADGKIKLYKLYETPDPAGVYVGEAEIAAHEADLERMRNEPLTVLIKGDDKPTTLGKINLSEFMSECPETVKKYEAGDFGIKPFDTKKEKGLVKRAENHANGERMMEVLPEIITEYNTCVK